MEERAKEEAQKAKDAAKVPATMEEKIAEKERVIALLAKIEAKEALDEAAGRLSRRGSPSPRPAWLRTSNTLSPRSS